MSFKDKKFQLTLNLEVINLLVHRVDILLLSELMFAFSFGYNLSFIVQVLLSSISSNHQLSGQS